MSRIASSTFVSSHSILEYLSRDDAERAAKELDGKELRGQPVRVSIDESVRYDGSSH